MEHPLTKRALLLPLLAQISLVQLLCGCSDSAEPSQAQRGALMGAAEPEAPGTSSPPAFLPGAAGVDPVTPASEPAGASESMGALPLAMAEQAATPSDEASTGGTAGAAAAPPSSDPPGTDGSEPTPPSSDPPGMQGPASEPTPAPTTIWLAGDSTVQAYAAGNTQGANGTELEGWGQEFARFFTPLVTVNNQAIGGRSVAFYLNAVVRDAAGVYQCVDDQGNPLYQLDAAGNRIDNTQWARVKAGIKAGDFLLIQFGTNDETHTCPRFVSLEDFQTDLGIMADTVRDKGATPIFVTPMSHRSFNGASVNNTLLPYANAMKAEAARVGVQVLDLNLRSVEYFQAVGNEFLATNIFDTGTTHFIAAGAVKMAELVAGEIRSQGGPLAVYLR